MRIIFLLAVATFACLGQSLDQGKMLYKEGRAAEARKILESVIDQNKTDAESRYWLAVVCLHRDIRDWETAVDNMEVAVETDPARADYQYMLGAAYGVKAQNSGIFKQAFLAPKIKKAFARAVELDPTHVDARISLAQYYLMAPGIMGGDDAEGFRHLDEVIKLNERRGRMTKASMLERKGKHDEAEGHWKALIAQDPKDWQSQKNYGYFLLRHNRAADGCAPMQRYVEARPDTADSYDSYGELLLGAGRTDEAIAQLKKALSINPSFAPSHNLLGQAFERQGKKSDARDAYQKALQYEQRENVRKEIEKRLKNVS